MRAVSIAVTLVAGCGDNLRGNMSIEPGRYGFAIGELVAMTPYRGLSIGTGGDLAIAVEAILGNATMTPPSCIF